MIRSMTKHDLATVTELEKQIFTSPWRYDSFESEMDQNPFAQLMVYEKNEEIVGYCDLWITYDQAQVANIAVAPAHRHVGIGRQMLEKMMKQAVEAGCEIMSLEVRVSNEPAISLYEKYGFIKANIRKDYYEDNHEDAWLMICPLGGIADDDDISD